MRAIILMFDSLNRHLLPPYAEVGAVDAPNFTRLAERSVTFDNFYAGSMPCMPARRELHTGRYNFLHRSWGPLEPFDDSMPEILQRNGIHTHLASDHPHYWEDGGATYHTRYSTWDAIRGQEGDPWKGDVIAERQLSEGRTRIRLQDAVNRLYMTTEDAHPQTRTVNAGVEFIETNARADDWMLQLELFDPHEPFFVPNAVPLRDEGTGVAYGRSDWPEYEKVTETEEEAAYIRARYADVLSMCDRSLGRVLDLMDRYGLWDDTILVVNTDHGYLLGEHGWWAKTVQPWFNELVHIPFFLWDPRAPRPGTRCSALAQTIDIAPTLLRFFDVEPTSDMQGQDLAEVVSAEEDVRPAALFGIHGGHVNVTDGRYVYMRAPRDVSNTPLFEYTLMPTHMRSRFAVEDLADWERAEPFSFTKGSRTMRIRATESQIDAHAHGTLLFDTETDPLQSAPLVDDDLEIQMLGLLCEALRASDAPADQYLRLGLPNDGVVGAQHLLVRAQRTRALALLEAIPPLKTLPAAQLLATPVCTLVQQPVFEAVLERHLPWLMKAEQLTLAKSVSLLDLAAVAALPVSTLRAIGTDFSLAPNNA